MPSFLRREAASALSRPVRRPIDGRRSGLACRFLAGLHSHRQHPCVWWDLWCIPCGSVPGRRRARSARSRDEHQPELPLAATVKKRISGVLEPAAAAKLAVARRAKPSAVPDHVRLVLSLEFRRGRAPRSPQEGTGPGRLAAPSPSRVAVSRAASWSASSRAAMAASTSAKDRAHYLVSWAQAQPCLECPGGALTVGVADEE